MFSVSGYNNNVVHKTHSLGLSLVEEERASRRLRAARYLLLLLVRTKRGEIKAPFAYSNAPSYSSSWVTDSKCAFSACAQSGRVLFVIPAPPASKGENCSYRLFCRFFFSCNLTTKQSLNTSYLFSIFQAFPLIYGAGAINQRPSRGSTPGFNWVCVHTVRKRRGKKPYLNEILLFLNSCHINR